MTDSDELFGSNDLDQERLKQEAKARKPRPPVSLPIETAETKMPDGRKLYIVDGYGLIYRSYFGFFKNPITDVQGNNVSAVFGFFSTLLKLLREYRPDYLVVAMDSHGPTFRHELYPEYKANRDAAPEDLHAQVPVISSILETLRIPTIAKVGVEADDIIASLSDEAARQDLHTILFTGDKDLLQLVDDHTLVLRPAKKNEKFYRLWGAREVREEFGIDPSQVVDYLSLIGDTSDNVPGVKGIGPKGAVKLLGNFGSLEEIYKHVDLCAKGMREKLETGRNEARLSRSLIVLKHDAVPPETFDPARFTVDDVDYGAAVPLFEKMGMRMLVREFGKLGTVPASPEPVEEPRKEASSHKGLYCAVRSLEELTELLERAEKESTVLAFDMETTSVDEMQAVPIGFSFCWQEGKAYYVPLVLDGESLLPVARVKEILIRYLEKGTLSLVGQNIKYDYKVLVNWGIRPSRMVFDTMIAAWLLDSTSVFNMDFLADKYLGYRTIHYTDVVPKGKLLSDIPLEQAVAYGAEDSDITFRLYRLFGELLRARGLLSLLQQVEMPLLRILADMELEGIFLDRSLIEPIRAEFKGRLARIEEKIFGICGHPFNLNSPKQLQEVLFVERDIPTGAKTRTGFSTANDVLEPLASTYPEVALLLQYRMLSKLKNTYIDKLPLEIDERTGRIHPQFSQTGTETGRLSCRNPNLQNIPIRTEEGRRIRDTFVPRPGFVFLSADYSQIELVVLAHMADDPGLKEAFATGEDVHRATASRIFGVAFDEVNADQRRMAKTINFGVMYGMSTHSLAQDLGIPYAEAAAFKQQYFQRYSAVQAFVSKTQERAERDGYVKTLLGHVRNIGEITSRNHVERAKAQRIAVNTVIQGSAADIMKLAMLRVSEALRQRKPDTRMILQIHDELIFEVPRNDVEDVRDLVRSAMEGAASLSVPLRVSIETGMSWGEMH